MKVWPFLVVLALAAAFYGAWRAYVVYAPDRYDVTAPLDLADAPTFVTDWKLRRASADECYAALSRAGVAFERLPDEIKGERCAFEEVAVLERSGVSWGGGVTLRCPMLAGIFLWERHALQPAAEEFFQSKVVRIRHYGTYACRNVNNRKQGRRSEHAFANAVDVAGFVLANGTEISVAADWGRETAKGAFLKAVHDAACARFRSVLGPDYNALHRDHFHFDNGGFMVCR